MNKETHSIGCNLFRLLILRKLDGERFSDSDSRQLKQHLQYCSSCCAFERTEHSILSFAISIPQFDVPEALTQKILVSINTQRPTPVFLNMTAVILPITLLVAALVWDYENPAAVMSWVIGFTAMFGLKRFLVSENFSG
jgi:hypothetical protein